MGRCLWSDMEQLVQTSDAVWDSSYATQTEISRKDAYALRASTMSRDIIAVVRAWYAHYNRGDGEPSLDYWHEDAEYRTAPDDPDSAVHRGVDAIRYLFASWREVYPDLRVEVREAKANRNQVFAWVRFVGRGAASGIPIHMELAHVCTMRNGKTARLVEYTDRTEALEAVGLSE